MTRTKIVSTLGPASDSESVITRMVVAGLDVVRINMSHGTHADHRRRVGFARAAAAERGSPLAVLVDLAGPKIRVGELASPVVLEADQVVTFAPEGHARSGELPTTYAELARDLSPGDAVLLDDGLLELVAVETQGDRSMLRVVRGGELSSHKGMNLPGVDVGAPSLTAKDHRDLDFAMEIGAEYVGLSFVRRASDVEELRSRVEGRALVVAKIEMARALRNLDEILEVADAVMVARGDLGVELPFERVPLAQKRIIQKANVHGRPVITATQMLESMIDAARPTRAEASDVANAILDGTDAVMLSGETAVGKYPVRSVEALVRIAREIESSGALDQGPRYLSPVATRSGATAREHAVASATVESVRQLGAPAIIVITRSGFSARLVSSYRPPVPIFAICTDHRTVSQLAGVWGVRPVLAEGEEVSYESLTEFGRRAVLESGEGEPGEPVVVSAGYPFHIRGTTNTMRVEQL